jgi:hypothetical protein
MRNKVISSLTLITFLFVSSACSHSPKKAITPDPREEISSSKEITRSLSPFKDDEPWWKKDENQWFFAFLIILGVGIFTSASMWIVYNSGGLNINVRK